ncbi:UDP-2,4-diacetamido-2,4,6-trideoxy-beta-L-altropyranose hydrolase [Paraliobacillus ryukyuensis]|uniref:UDP-2,4-diacetamido-2,4, 6-trideoxy-beta-L-altropyranose hydrolase n=1 Tax=Paraliobacillus ryukyuensis TaxID=200904 RepID=UPI0009A7FA4D|nr:UDP-2,4-diacetamido-2,4,6-trideoxy-beta-L-altropyranose hydrolase [Paraliobacillus ryukyuensis]
MRVLIFTEGGSETGFGHISRCSSLFEELAVRGIEAEFIINADCTQIEIIKDKKYKLVNWLSQIFLKKYIKKTDFCIVDSYLADESLCQTISSLSKKTLFIDDDARINYPEGIVVNPASIIRRVNYPIKQKNYLFGPEYIVLRRPFISVKRESISHNVKEVLITLGGTDMHNLTPSIINSLCNIYPEITFNVVVGMTHKNRVDLKDFKSKNIIFYKDIKATEMKAVMLKSDFAITAAGQTIYELLATDTPFIPIQVAENQINNIEMIREFRYSEIILDYKDPYLINNLLKAFEKLLDFNKRFEIFNKIQGVLKGSGSEKIIDELLKQ